MSSGGSLGQLRDSAVAQFRGRFTPGVIHRQTGGGPDPNRPGASLPKVTEPHDFEGFFRRESVLRPGSSIRDVRGVISILGTVPVVPQNGDDITFSQQSYRVLEVEQDAAGVFFRCEVIESEAAP